ncbi:MAG: pyridoxamine 5'-phosphate oxidase family protein [Porticoccaceae bacterium]|nr:pyridoxamine 5'-phosphate oxidase family protein [Porticoccaceae bacterium]
MELSSETIELKLNHWPVARLATINPDASPHQAPVVFVWHGRKIWSPVDGKPKRQAQLVRVKNALARPVGSLLLDEYQDDWSQLWWLRVDVKIKVIDLKTASDATKIDTAQAIAALEKKYPQYQNTSALREPATLLLMTPSGYSSWRAS